MHAVSAGVLMKAAGPNLVPLQEEHEARLERGIRLAEWYELDVFERALIVAVRRNHSAVANIQAEADIEHSKAQARRKGK